LTGTLVSNLRVRSFHAYDMTIKHNVFFSFIQILYLQIKVIVVLQWIVFLVLVVCAVFLGSFVTQYKEFEKCPNTTLDINSLPMTYEGSCIEDKQPLLGVSVGCIVVVVLCFIVIAYAWNDRTLKLDANVLIF
jgi:hypothetical protein